jgi:hypothetical protein
MIIHLVHLRGAGTSFVLPLDHISTVVKKINPLAISFFGVKAT